MAQEHWFHLLGGTGALIHAVPAVYTEALALDVLLDGVAVQVYVVQKVHQQTDDLARLFDSARPLGRGLLPLLFLPGLGHLL